MKKDHSADTAPKRLADVLANITDPLRWINRERLVELIGENPSLRGFVYGYASEDEFIAHLEALGSVEEHFKDDDHKKTKSDRTFVFRARRYTVQLKSLQTNSIKETKQGVFTATIQNDASDRRTVELPNGHKIETTCYVVGEYDILGVSLQPFLGKWGFAFKKNKDLRRTTYAKYDVADRQYLLSSLEPIEFPLDKTWTQDLGSLLADPDLGRVHVADQTPDQETKLVEPPGSKEKIVVKQKSH